MKKCKACSVDFDESEFYKGHAKCKPCTRAAVRRNRVEKLDYYRAYDRLRFYEHGARGKASKEAVSRGSAAWVARNAEKRSAHLAVEKAVKRGDMTKPLLCETCSEQRPLHGHHDDYSKPLEVRWLCSPCHRAWHRKYDEAGTRAIVEAKRKAG